MSDLTTLKKRRGVARASITHLVNRLKELESDTDKPTTLNLAQGMANKLETLDNDFRTHHHVPVDLIDDEGTLSEEPAVDLFTKHVLISDVAKTFDVLGWFSPAIIKVKILMKRLWELKMDDPLHPEVHDAWLSELKCLSNKHIPRCYFQDGTNIIAVELHELH
jgi:hypothetical protein